MEMLSPDHEALFSVAQPRRFQRTEYDRLVELGCFDGERVELLFGVLVPMSPIDHTHANSTRLIHELLLARLAGRATVFCQAPLAATDDSEPEPDVLVTPTTDHWAGHPTRACLVVEVARTSLAIDRGPKAQLYSRSDVDEYWIVDHVNGQVEVFRDAVDGQWQTRTAHQRGDTIRMRAFPDASIDVADILPPLG